MGGGAQVIIRRDVTNGRKTRGKGAYCSQVRTPSVQLLHLLSASKRVMFNVWMWWSHDALVWAGFYDYPWLDLFCRPTKHQLLQPACRTMSLLLVLLLWGSLSATRLPLGAWLYPIPELCRELGISQDLLGGLFIEQSQQFSCEALTNLAAF